MHFYHLIFVILDASRINRHIFEVSKIYENIFDASTLLLMCRVHFWMRRGHFGRVVDILDASAKHPIIFQCYCRRVVHIFDASKKTLNYSSIFPRRVKNVQDASPKYATIFQCYFGLVMQIFDVSKIIFMTPPPE